MKKMELSIDKTSSVPIFRQLIEKLEAAVRTGELSPGEILPSMNVLASRLGISRETVKKAYDMLRDGGLLESRQGKGFYVAGARRAGRRCRVLVILDKQSIYKQLFLKSLQDRLGSRADVTILFHNQDTDLLDYYLGRHLDNFDYYLVSPHFALDEKAQGRAARLLRRIPNRKLIMVDNWLRSVPGNYGAVYQDFAQDAYDGLTGGLEKLRRAGRLKVIRLSSSLYGEQICASVGRFCRDNGIRAEFYDEVPDSVSAGDVFLLLNSQLDWGYVSLSQKIRESGLSIGTDVGIISYNEFPLNEVVLGGLTTISTDFSLMGRTAAEMVLCGKLHKVHNEFSMTHRKSF